MSIIGNPIIMGSPPQPSSGYYVVWLNYDDTVLSIQQYAAGATPSYSGTPTRPNSLIRTYTFSGWEPAITTVTGNTVYKAQYTSTLTGCIEFRAANMFYLSKTSQLYDGTIEYLANGTTWTTWDGSRIASNLLDNHYAIALRGINNTYVKGNGGSTKSFSIAGSVALTLSGNIENLLDYQTVINNQYPTMADSCFQYLFMNVTEITSLDIDLLPATTLSNQCYQYMFYNTGITSLPNLPATTLTPNCYQQMFASCSNLTTIPTTILHATSLASYCYDHMFYGCSSLVSLPAGLLPITSLQTYCYQSMFSNCTSLTSIPAGFLPATTMKTYCYYQMFRGCSKLATLPANLLPATTLASRCYGQMFYGCQQLTCLPVLAATTLQTYCYYQMFQACEMIKISDTQTGDYQTAYRIPSSGTGTTASSALNNMFTGTGGAFTGTPTINTTYYTSNTVL